MATKKVSINTGAEKQLKGEDPKELGKQAYREGLFPVLDQARRDILDSMQRFVAPASRSDMMNHLDDTLEKVVTAWVQERDIVENNFCQMHNRVALFRDEQVAALATIVNEIKDESCTLTSELEALADDPIGRKMHVLGKMSPKKARSRG